jgi:hypothetical protein
MSKDAAKKLCALKSAADPEHPSTLFCGVTDLLTTYC